MSRLEVRNLCKKFGQLAAVEDVSFHVQSGQILGLIGRNGAGKTTTIRMIMNIIGPDSGAVFLDGDKVGESFRRMVSYLPEERGLYKKMTVTDTLNFFMEIKGLKPAHLKQQMLEYLDRFDLADRQQSKIEDLSKGNQQKVQFITAILSDPKILILDEPFSGLDPVNTDILKEIILEMKQQGKLIIFSTHLMDFAERMCDHIALIHRGELKLNDSLTELKSKFSERHIMLDYEGDISFLLNLPWVEEIQNHGNAKGIKVAQEEDIQRLLRSLLEHNILVKRFDANDISLQDIFLQVVDDA
ncbi:MAG: hypothetical protein CMP91_12135 [Gammaproteobacteria bacterium]|nr:hypothetical protein [Gammaproteobacteria bacterium]|tara:strand:+ start:1575 stop:2474 length:900 start_codon:yes stop_codon:yes gene_type:complete